MAEIVFVTLFLGLVSGEHPVELRADPAVHSIRVVFNERELATMREPPWRTIVDFGPLAPGRLTAIAYDADGKEIARTSQIVNLPRPFADVSIVVQREDGIPAAVQLVGHHLQFAKPKSARVRVDGTTLPVTNFTARLPKLNWTKPHVIEAQMTFVDRTIARQEGVLLGGSYASSSEMTPLLIEGTPAKLDDCFSLQGDAIEARTVETPPALIVFVKDPDARYAQTLLKSMGVWSTDMFRRRLVERDLTFGSDTDERLIWPIAQRFRAGRDESHLFNWSGDVQMDAASALAYPMAGIDWEYEPRLFADAVAVAALQTITKPLRRAVVLVLDGTADKSEHDPAEVRGYLAQIGVPLYVWSLSGPQQSAWGDAIDISKREKLHSAVVALRKEIASQRIVWLPVDPLSALRVKSSAGCGATVVH